MLVGCWEHIIIPMYYKKQQLSKSLWNITWKLLFVLDVKTTIWRVRITFIYLILRSHAPPVKTELVFPTGVHASLFNHFTLPDPFLGLAFSLLFCCSSPTPLFPPHVAFEQKAMALGNESISFFLATSCPISCFRQAHGWFHLLFHPLPPSLSPHPKPHPHPPAFECRA